LDKDTKKYIIKGKNTTISQVKEEQQEINKNITKKLQDKL